MGKKTGRPPGRPTKLTAERLNKALEARRLSMSMKDSAAAAGIDSSTHENWMKRGEEDANAGRDTLFSQYFRMLPLASAEGVASRLKHVERIARRKVTTAVKVQQGRLMLGLVGMMATHWEGRVRLRLERKRLEAQLKLGLPLEPPAQESGPALDFSHLSEDEHARYRALAERARSSFETMPPAEVAELQALLRKMRGQEVHEQQPSVDSVVLPVVE